MNGRVNEMIKNNDHINYVDFDQEDSVGSLRLNVIIGLMSFLVGSIFTLIVMSGNVNQEHTQCFQNKEYVRIITS